MSLKDPIARKAYYAAYREKNREKLREQNRVRHAAMPARRRENWRKQKYGLTQSQIDAMLITQGGVCAICATTQPGGQGTWHVDHDHSSGKIRGLLCQRCNVGLGNFQDQPDRLRVAANYLEKHSI